MKVCILGVGYRAIFYIEEIKKIKELELIGTLVHKETDIEIIKEKYGINAYTNKEDILSLKPDFIINTISKNENTKISEYFLLNKIPVLQETPLSTSINNIDDFIKYKSLYQIAEQYKYYKYFIKIKELINKIGEVSEIIISYLHDYHAISIIRYLIGDFNKLNINGYTFNNSLVRTKDRYNDYHDGVLKNSKTKNIFLKWDNINVIYNFSSDEYRSTIRKPYLIIKGQRGEIINDKCIYLDTNNYLNEIIIDNYGIYDDTYPIGIILNKMIDFVKTKNEFYKLEDAIIDSKISYIMNSLDYDIKNFEFKN